LLIADDGTAIDGRVKPGHDEFSLYINNIVMPGPDPGISAPAQIVPVSLKPL
jgi:hypothetical protein